MDRDPEEEVIVCGICKDIMMGKEGEPDTLLDHMVSEHGRPLSPENFTAFTLKVAQDTGFPNKCLSQTTPEDPETDEEAQSGQESTGDTEHEVIVCAICKEVMLGKEGGPDTLLAHMVSDHRESASPKRFTEFTLKVAVDTGLPPSPTLEYFGRPDADWSYSSDEANCPCTVQDGPWIDSSDAEAMENAVRVKTKDGPRFMDREIYIDKHSGQQILALNAGDPSHLFRGKVNTLKEKAAAVAGTLLTTPNGLGALPIPSVLKKLVRCWNHRVYRHRYTAESLKMEPREAPYETRRCSICCKEAACRACCGGAAIREGLLFLENAAETHEQNSSHCHHE